MHLSTLRRQLLVLVGLPLAGCAARPEGEVCTPDLQRTDDRLDVPAESVFLSCVVEPEGGCAPADEMAFDDLAATGDASCWYDGNVLCGPDQADGEKCCYEVEITGETCEGRPFAPTGESRHAAPGTTHWGSEVAPRRAPAEVARAWRQAALDEHASVASFARFTLQLLALGAPPELVAGATRAQADEVRHARAAFGLAAALGDDGAVGPLDVRGEVDAEPLTVLRETFLGGCVGETVAAAVAAAASEQATDPHTRDLLASIAADETRHAALAWKTVRWLLAAHPHLRDALGTLVAVRPAGGPATAEAPGWGRLDAREQDALVAAVMARVVRPLLSAVLAEQASPSDSGSRSVEPKMGIEPTTC